MLRIPEKILIIQSAFIGDAILASSMVESWASKYPNSTIDVLVRKGNESLFLSNPRVRKVLIWDKKQRKYSNLFKLINKIRTAHYDAVFNVQRFMATGLLTVLSGAKITHGYRSNPLSLFFTNSIEFDTNSGLHEIDRNALLLAPYFTEKALKPKLYPTKEDDNTCKRYKDHDYVCMAPTSVWFTKQWPKENWIKLIRDLTKHQSVFIYLLGAPGDVAACETIRKEAGVENVINLSGKLNFMESASLMRDARMNYTNDSAPMHIASSMNAPVTAIYCSTLPSFGFGPLSDRSVIVEYKGELYCRPCGLHGKDHCPEGHFNCSKTIDQVLN